MVIKVVGLSKLVEKLDGLAQVDIKPIIIDSTLRVQARAKELAPVVTGTLQASIRASIIGEGNNTTGVVHTNVEYAPYQEFGTVKMAAQPFLRPALKIEEAGIRRRMRKYIKDKLAE